LSHNKAKAWGEQKLSNEQSLNDFVEEAISIISEAQKRGIILRVIGAIAFKIHCPKHGKIFATLKREISDIDVVGVSKQITQIRTFFEDIGYKERPLTLSLASANRLIFIDEQRKRHVDVFLDKLLMCHTLDFRNRLEIDYPTLSLADLLLEKMQIVKLNEKDIKDTIVLLMEHNVGESDHETINVKYIAKILSDDWGFYFTVTTNLKKVREYIFHINELSNGKKEEVESKINEILKRIEEEPKSVRWKMRAKLGTKKKWYREVESIPGL
jgi:hypothetical protein